VVAVCGLVTVNWELRSVGWDAAICRKFDVCCKMNVFLNVKYREDEMSMRKKHQAYIYFSSILTVVQVATSNDESKLSNL
jgi:hypothetical protein